MLLLVIIAPCRCKIYEIKFNFHEIEIDIKILEHKIVDNFIDKFYILLNLKS